MKTLKISFAICALLAITACGPSQKEMDKEKQKEDSIAAIDNDQSLENAEKLLQMQDSLDAIPDTMQQQEK